MEAGTVVAVLASTPLEVLAGWGVKKSALLAEPALASVAKIPTLLLSLSFSALVLSSAFLSVFLVHCVESGSSI